MSVLEMILHDIGDSSLPKSRRAAAVFCLLVGGVLLILSTFCFMNGFILILNGYGWVPAVIYSVVITGFYLLAYLSIRLN